MPALVASPQADASARATLSNWALKHRNASSFDGLFLPSSHNNRANVHVADFERSFSDLGSIMNEFCARESRFDRATVLRLAFACILGLRGYTEQPVFGFIAGGDAARVGPCSFPIPATASIEESLVFAADQPQHGLPVNTVLQAGLPIWGASLEYAEQYEPWALEQELLPGSSLHLAFRDGVAPGSLEVRFSYRPNVISAADASYFLRHIHSAILQIARCEDLNQCLGAFDVKSDHELELLLHTYRQAPDHGSPRIPENHNLIHEYVSAHAKATPHAIAVESAEGTLSYRDLDRHSNSLAHALIAAGAQPGQHIAIYMEKSIRLFVGIVAIHKVGGCVTPLGLENPPAKNLFILKQTDAKIIIIDESASHVISTKYDFSELPATPTLLEITEGRWVPSEDTWGPVEVDVTPSTPAYIVYTSGTTGEPKGVILMHSNVVSFIQARMDGWNLDRTSKVLQLSNYVWDVSIGETVSAFSTGCCLYTVERMEAAARLDAVIEENNITHTIMTPTMAGLLATVPKCLKAILVTGEPLPVALRNKLVESVPCLINGGAPSEVTIIALATQVRKAHTRGPWTPFGRPMGDVNAYVLDHNLGVVPIGAVGELCLTGKQVAAGYLHRPDATAKAFVPNPFLAVDKADTLYHTGDLARLRADGMFELLGRQDGQIKFHGIRLESLEIESAILSASEEITQAALTISKVGEVDKLVAFVVLRKNYEAGVKDVVKGQEKDAELKEALEKIKKYVGSKLSSHAVPSQLWALHDLPRTPSGKVDRRAVKVLATELALQQAAAPRAPVAKSAPKPNGTIPHLNGYGNGNENGVAAFTPKPRPVPAYVNPEALELVRSAYSQVLNLDSATIDNNADFLTIGGDSLSAIRLSIQLRKAGLDVAARTFLAGSSILSIAALAPPSFSSKRANGSNGVITKDEAVPNGTQSKSKGAADLTPLELEYVLYKHSIEAYKVEDAFFGSFYQRGSVLIAFAARAPRPQSMEYNSLTVEIQGDPSPELVLSCLGVLMRKHEALRTVLAVTQTMKLANIVLKPEYYRPDWITIDASHGSADEQDAAFQSAITQAREQGYVTGTPALRMIYARATKRRPAQLVWNGPHSILDGWSLSTWNNDLADLLNGQEGIKPTRYRPFADFLAARDLTENVSWMRQELLPVTKPVWPIRNLKQFPVPVCDAAFYTEWKFNAGSTFSKLGVSQFAACLSALAVTVAQRERSLDTDRGVTLGYLTSGRSLDMEGIQDVTGCCIDLMVTKLNPRLDKTGREFLTETQERTAGALGRDHSLEGLMTEINKGKVGQETNATLQQVTLAFQNMPTISRGEGEKYSVKRLTERLPALSSLFIEVFPEEPQADGAVVWNVRCSHNRSILPSEQAAVFIDDMFVHLQGLLLHADEKLSEVAVLIPGQYSSEDRKDVVPFVPTPVFERQHEAFPLGPGSAMSSYMAIWMSILTIILFNLRLSMFGPRARAITATSTSS
ncbi:hypothetical protein BOTBODRAFT_51444 [Botryobasidium botryosum FD-172 SS1]|uniref:Carrier domain-containing protein n=1 Tax=Botryobasidium botryosum (strain FD-172 SS1) TaxID=930990 RepID=A0A067N7H5_BOTB1|nr:hypothetical protein BOTBODRAFT_51444 [Botryobasidium botryosum FD-172 SS1]